MNKKPKTALLVKDVERMRARLNISALRRVRVLLESGDQKLAINMECIACEELLEWVPSKQWWTCVCCGQETTENEAGEVFAACAEALQRVLGDEDEEEESEDQGSDPKVAATKTEDDGKGTVRRWAGRIRSRMTGR